MKEIEENCNVNNSVDIELMFFKRSKFLDALFKTSLFLGVLVSWFYFSFFVGVLPSFNSIGDATGYLVFIVIWSLLITSLIGLISFAPFFLVRDLYLKRAQNKKRKGILSIFFIIVPISVLIISSFEPSYKWINQNPGLFFLVSSVFFPFIFTLLLNYKKTIVENKLLVLLDSEAFFFLVVYAVFMTIAVLLCFEINKWLLIFIGFLVYINAMIIFEEKYTPKMIFGVIIFMIMVFSMSSSFAKIDNLIIVKPFEMLKLGHYKAELHFKDDFASKEQPFILNENNQTYGIFYILSSIGDEYIIKEIRDEESSKLDKIFYRFNIKDSDYYYGNDNNLTYVKDKKGIFVEINASNKNYIHVNEEANILRGYGKNIDRSIYRIKKDDIAYEKAGKEYDNAFTSWLVNR